MIRYAADDVLLLFELFDKLKEFAESEVIDLVKQLSARHSASYKNAQRPVIGIPRTLHFDADNKPQYNLPESITESSSATQDTNDQELSKLIDTMPAQIRAALTKALEDQPDKVFVELVLDNHAAPCVRFGDNTETDLPVYTADFVSEALKQLEKTQEAEKVGFFFTKDNRVGLSGTLHRISAIRDRHQEITGLTYRVGRHIGGVANLIKDVLSDLDGQSLLLLGPPGVGKTSLLRDVINFVAMQVKKRVVGGQSELHNSSWPNV